MIYRRFYHTGENPSQGTAFSSKDGKYWTCLHGGWGGYLNMTSMYEDKYLKKLITTYDHYVTFNSQEKAIG